MVRMRPPSFKYYTVYTLRPTGAGRHYATKKSCYRW